MDNVQALVSTEQTDFFKQLELTTEQRVTVKTLSEDIVVLEAYRGRNALELGQKLKSVRDLLGNRSVGRDGSAWQLWCDNFVYSKDYANRLIQVAEVFKDSENIEKLSIRHLREIARYGDSKADRDELIALVNEHNLGVHETRTLVTDMNKDDKLSLDAIVAQHPDLKRDLDLRIREAKRGSQEKIEELQNKVTSQQEQNEVLRDEIEVKSGQAEKLATLIRTDEAATKLGDGDADKGQLRIELEQKSQENDNLRLSLTDAQRKLQSKQHEHDRLLDAKKLLEEVERVFLGSLAPASFSMRVQRINDEGVKGDLLKAVDAVEDWARTVRAQLAS